MDASIAPGDDFFAFANAAWLKTAAIPAGKQRWGKITEDAMRKQVTTSDHAPEDYRADTVRNLDAWYDAFNVRPGQRLYLAPWARVRVW